MRCIEPRAPARGRAARFAAAAGAAALVLAIAACRPPVPPAAPSAAPSAVPQAESQAVPATATRPPAPPPPAAVRSLQQLRLQAAQRLVAANPGATYEGAAPDPLLAIPVLEIELNADGSVRRIVVLRQPRQARETTQLAIDAVRRAAPFGDVSRLPRPWKFTETFVFDDKRRFKPRTLEP